MWDVHRGAPGHTEPFEFGDDFPLKLDPLTMDKVARRLSHWDRDQGSAGVAVGHGGNEVRSGFLPGGLKAWRRARDGQPCECQAKGGPPRCRGRSWVAVAVRG